MKIDRSVALLVLSAAGSLAAISACEVIVDEPAKHPAPPPPPTAAQAAPAAPPKEPKVVTMHLHEPGGGADPAAEVQRVQDVLRAEGRGGCGFVPHGPHERAGVRPDAGRRVRQGGPCAGVCGPCRRAALSGRGGALQDERSGLHVGHLGTRQ
jgi:hypothetical protein